MNKNFNQIMNSIEFIENYLLSSGEVSYYSLINGSLEYNNSDNIQSILNELRLLRKMANSLGQEIESYKHKELAERFITLKYSPVFIDTMSSIKSNSLVKRPN